MTFERSPTVRGSITQRSPGSWSLILDLGHELNPETGTLQRKQKWHTFRGTKKDAQAKLTELLRAVNRGEYVETSKLTFGEWLTEWLDKAIKPPAKRLSTYRTYHHVIEDQVKPAIGMIRLQALKATDLKRYYTDQQKLSPATLAQHHAILSAALKAAVLDGLVTRNVASLVIGKPRAELSHDAVIQNCWEAEEAQTFLVTAKAAGPQSAALYALALDSGARKNELCGLQWPDLDLDKGTATFVRQLVTTGRYPVFGPVKNGTPRTVDLATETVELLKTHKRAQAELKMRNRTVYQDHALVFAKEWGDLHGRQDSLGLPLQSNNIGQREFASLLKAAKVKRITIHGLRHTSATLLLKAGVPPQVVQQRLGHKKIAITLDIYAHVLPSMGQDAAQRIGALLHGLR
jgi:integrase